MKADIWMPLYINDYLGDTMHLSAEENGVYLLLMMHYWKKGLLKDNIPALTVVTRSSEEITRAILNEFFILIDDEWTHSRIDKEIESASSRREAARLNGLKGGRPKNPRKTHRLTDRLTDRFGVGKPTENPRGNPQKSSSPLPSPLPKPKPISKEKIYKKENSKIPKHKHGEYQHVLLTEDQHNKLIAEWGPGETARMITVLDEGIQLKGYKYRDHNLALRNWEKREKANSLKNDKNHVARFLGRCSNCKTEGYVRNALCEKCENEEKYGTA